MASDVMSLFGLDPQMLQSQRVKEGVDQASRMSADYAVGAAGGTMLGAGVNSMLGLQTPEMQQAAQIQESLAGVDINDAAGLRRAASQLMLNGQYAQAMALYQQAREVEQTNAAELRAQESHEFGQVKEIHLGDIGTDAFGMPVPIKTPVRILPDGSMINLKTGQKIDPSKVEVPEEGEEHPEDADLVWRNGNWVTTKKEETETALTEEESEEVTAMKEAAAQLPEDSEKRKTIEANAAKKEEELKKQKQQAVAKEKAYLVNRMKVAMRTIEKLTDDKGRAIKGNAYGRAEQVIESVKREWFNLTGQEWTPENLK